MGKEHLYFPMKTEALRKLEKASTARILHYSCLFYHFSLVPTNKPALIIETPNNGSMDLMLTSQFIVQ